MHILTINLVLYLVLSMGSFCLPASLGALVHMSPCLTLPPLETAVLLCEFYLFLLYFVCDVHVRVWMFISVWAHVHMWMEARSWLWVSSFIDLLLVFWGRIFRLTQKMPLKHLLTFWLVFRFHMQSNSHCTVIAVVLEHSTGSLTLAKWPSVNLVFAVFLVLRGHIKCDLFHLHLYKDTFWCFVQQWNCITALPSECILIFKNQMTQSGINICFSARLVSFNILSSSSICVVTSNRLSFLKAH